MEGLSPIQPPKIGGVVGDEREIALEDSRDQIVILGRGQAEEVDVIGLVTCRVPDLGERGGCRPSSIRNLKRRQPRSLPVLREDQPAVDDGASISA
jgi:hypothetical protein